MGYHASQALSTTSNRADMACSRSLTPQLRCLLQGPELCGGSSIRGRGEVISAHSGAWTRLQLQLPGDGWVPGAGSEGAAVPGTQAKLAALLWLEDPQALQDRLSHSNGASRSCYSAGRRDLTLPIFNSRGLASHPTFPLAAVWPPRLSL